LHSNDILLKIIEKKLNENLELSGTEFFIEENDFYDLAKKTRKISTTLIDSIKDELKKSDRLIHTGKKNKFKEPILLRAKFDYIKERFLFVLLPTNSEIKDLNDRESLRQSLFESELSSRILDLTYQQSVTLINDVLGFDDFVWIKKFRKGKITRDGGVDFTAEIRINKNNLIGYDGSGIFSQMFGQLKHLKGKMTEPAMRDFVGSMTSSSSKIHYGMVISSRGFSKDCLKYVSNTISSKANKINEIFCYDVDYIARLMIKYKIGLNRNRIKTGYFIDEYWWDEIESNPS